jgi:hypothetical protein
MVSRESNTNIQSNLLVNTVETVTSRIFYYKRHNWTHLMTFQEFRDCNLLPIIRRLETVEDMNSVSNINLPNKQNLMESLKDERPFLI